MELTLVGLQYSGKTTFVNVIAVSKVGGLIYPESDSETVRELNVVSVCYLKLRPNECTTCIYFMYALWHTIKCGI